MKKFLAIFVLTSTLAHAATETPTMFSFCSTGVGSSVQGAAHSLASLLNYINVIVSSKDMDATQKKNALIKVNQQLYWLQGQFDALKAYVIKVTV